MSTTLIVVVVTLACVLAISFFALIHWIDKETR